MLNIILLILLAIAVVVIVQQWRYRQRIIKQSSEMLAEAHAGWREIDTYYVQLKLDYDALEKGRTEQEDNYEQQFLTFKEEVAMTRNSAEYDRQAREEAERLLALKDRVIEHHAGHCETILKEVVDEMVKTLQPEEPADG